MSETRGSEVVEIDRQHIWHPYTQAQTAPMPFEIVSGHGAKLVGGDGREYDDLISSWWVNIHGHAHPAIARAIGEQAAKLEQVIFADFAHAPASLLAKRLVEVLPQGLNRVFYSDNGSTAVEVALKAAYQYWQNRGETRRRRIVAFEGAYHGDTFGAMAAGATSGFFGAFGPLLFEVDFLPFPQTWDGDAEVSLREAQALAALDTLLVERANEIAAVIIEPLVQGATGMRMCRPEFLRALARRVHRAGALLIFDEVMTGFGRTGAMFASQKAEVTPDFICLSKGLTAGFLPMSATVCREEIYREFFGPTFDRALAHGHSFTANPLGCAAALASLKVFEEERSLEKVAAIERIHRERMAELAKLPRVTRARVIGDIAAFDLDVGDAGYGASVGKRLKQFFFERGFVIRPLGNVVYLLPPYCVAHEDLHRAYDAIAEGVTQVG